MMMIIQNNQNPPVTAKHIQAADLTLRATLIATDFFVCKGKQAICLFSEVTWGYGASGMLFANGKPITDRPVPCMEEKSE